MKSVVSVLDFRAGQNLIHLRCLAENWCPAIRPENSQPLIDPSNLSMERLNLLVLFVRVGQLRARVQFSVVASMPIDCILRTTFIDRHSRANEPPQRKVLSHNAPTVALLGAKQTTAETSFNDSHTKTGAVSDLHASKKIRLVKMGTVPAMT